LLPILDIITSHLVSIVLYCYVCQSIHNSKEEFVPYLNDYNWCILHVVVLVYCVAAWNWCSTCTGFLLNLPLGRTVQHIETFISARRTRVYRRCISEVPKDDSDIVVTLNLRASCTLDVASSLKQSVYFVVEGLFTVVLHVSM
jgi:hypothetical protein